MISRSFKFGIEDRISCPSSRFLFIIILLPEISSALVLNLTVVRKYRASVEDTGAVVPSKPFGHVAIFAEIGVGQSEFKQLVQIDPGSSPLWIQCGACEGCPQPDRTKYDPSKSPTFRSIKCRVNQECIIIGGEECDNARKRYVFGCVDSYTNKEDEEESGSENGVMGMGFDTNSIVSHFGFIFSNCFGPIGNGDSQYHKLFLGENANFIDPYTPMVSTQRGFYYVKLNEVIFGNARLDIPDDVFELNPDLEDPDMLVGGTIFDVGCTSIYLLEGAYIPFTEAAKRFLDQQIFTEVPVENWELCYLYDRRLEGFPTITLRFERGVGIVLKSDNLFVVFRDRISRRTVACFLVSLEDRDTEMNIIGLYAQQNYNVGFDGLAKKIYIRRAACEDI